MTYAWFTVYVEVPRSGAPPKFRHEPQPFSSHPTGNGCATVHWCFRSAGGHSNADNSICFSNLKINFTSSIWTPQQTQSCSSLLHCTCLFVTPQTPPSYRHNTYSPPQCFSLSWICEFHPSHTPIQDTDKYNVHNYD